MPVARFYNSAEVLCHPAHTSGLIIPFMKLLPVPVLKPPTGTRPHMRVNARVPLPHTGLAQGEEDPQEQKGKWCKIARDRGDPHRGSLLHKYLFAPFPCPLSLQASDLGVSGSPGKYRPWGPGARWLAAPELLRGQPRQELKQLSKPPQQCQTAQTAYPCGTHSAPEKPGTRAWQTTSNAALGLSVSLCWLKLLLASALAFNFHH